MAEILLQLELNTNQSCESKATFYSIIIQMNITFARKKWQKNNCVRVVIYLYVFIKFGKKMTSNQNNVILISFCFHTYKRKKKNIHTFRKLDEEDSLEQLKEHDGDNDGKVSWKEYISKQYGYNPEDLEDFKHRDEEDLEDFNKVKGVCIQKLLLIGVFWLQTLIFWWQFFFFFFFFFPIFLLV